MCQFCLNESTYICNVLIDFTGYLQTNKDKNDVIIYTVYID